MLFTLKIMTVIVLDHLFGDPHWFPHPVRIIGWFCSRSETFFISLFRSKKIAGVGTVVVVLLATILAVGILIETMGTVSHILSGAIAILLLYTSIAVKDMLDHSRRVYDDLHSGDLVAARQSLSMIVGRDTKDLEKPGIVRACIETVAENMVDGVTAPLFYGIVASMIAPISGFNDIEIAAFGAMTYRAINTMDSMFGYKNEKYLQFGWAAARLDDIANFIPARISALMMIVAAFVMNLNGKTAARIFFRDRRNHVSPNSAHTESVVAGALGVQLGGDSSYFGKVISKPTIGDDQRDVSEQDILITGKLMQVGSLLFVILLLVIKVLLMVK